MALFAYLAGTDKAHKIRLNGLGLTSRSDGTVGFGGIIFDDDDGTLNVRGWMQVVVKETACTSAPILYSGFIGPRRYLRSGESVYRLAAARFIDSDIVDQNAVLNIRLITGTDGKRPAETHNERIDWLLGSDYIGGMVIDDGFVAATHPRPFEEADYRGQYPLDVLNDLAGPIFKTFFVYPIQPTGTYGLFFDSPDATVGTSTLTISNVLSDVTFDAFGQVTGTCFPPLVDAVLSRDPSEVYAKVRYRYRNGVVIENDNTTYNTFFSAAATGGLDLGYRGLQVDNDRIGLESSARIMADGILDKDGDEADTVTVTVQLPPDKVGLIDVGQRIQVRFTHLEGYDPAVYTRVTARTISQTPGNEDMYDVTLELNTHGVIGSGGGGSPGDFPSPPASPPAIVQFISGPTNVSHQLTFNSAPGPGNTIVAFVTHRGGVGTPFTGAGWTEHSHGSITPGSDSARLMYRPTVTGEDAIIDLTNTNSGWAAMWEISGVVTPDVESFADVDTSTQPGSINAGLVTTTASALVLSGLCMHCSDWGGNGDTTVGADALFTNDAKHEVNDTVDTSEPFTADTSHPLTWVGHYEPSAAGSYGPSIAVSGAGFNFGGWGGLQFAFQGAASDNPPSPGQWVYNETPTPAPGGGRVTFFTMFPFADGSLQVFVDHVDQTGAIVSYDGAAGSFTLAFDPRSWETILVNYQGR